MKKFYLFSVTYTSTHAVHLEFTTPLLGLLRFIARRGIPNMIISGNFQAFKAQHVKIFCKVNGTKQKFVLERFSWWEGGLLRLLRVRLTYDKIHTFICEIENILNTRPLTYLSEEHFDEPLTPFHLIHERNLANTIHFTITKNMTDNDARNCCERVQHQFYISKSVSIKTVWQNYKNKRYVKIENLIIVVVLNLEMFP